MHLLYSLKSAGEAEKSPRDYDMLSMEDGSIGFTALKVITTDYT